MLTLQLISIELILGVILFGACAAWKKSLGNRLCFLGAVPVAFLLSFAVAKLGAWNFFGTVAQKIADGAMSGVGLGEDAVPTASKLIHTIAASVGAHLMFVPVFWIFLLLLGIVIRIVLKKTKAAEKCALFAEQSHPGFRIGTCAVGAVRSFAVLMLSLFPIVALLSLPAPALEKAQAESYEGTYVAEIGNYVDEYYYRPLNDSILMKANRYTGMQALLCATSDSVANHRVTVDADVSIDVNVNRLLRELLEDGVTGMALYEYWSDPSQHSLQECIPLAELLHDLSDEEILMQVGLEYAKNSLSLPGQEDEMSFQKSLMETIEQSHYKDLSETVSTLGDVVELLATNEQSTTLEVDDLKDFLFEALEDNGTATRVTELLAPSKLCCEILASSSVYGLELICQTVNISKNQEEFHKEFLQNMQTALNESNIVETDLQEVEQFICYLIENNMTVKGYAPSADEEQAALTNGWYDHYQSYITKERQIRKVYFDFLLIKSPDLLFFSPTEQTAYRYDLTTDQWAVVTEWKATDATDLTVQFLTEKANQLHHADGSTEMVTEEMMATWVTNNYTAYVEKFTGILSADAKECAHTLAYVLVKGEYFQPNTVYAEDIVSAISTEAFRDSLGSRENIESFSKIISTASILLLDMTDKSHSDVTMLQKILSNFSDIGVLLDSMSDFEATAEVPGEVIRALSDNKYYRAYFADDVVEEMIRNAEEGLATYESLFASIETLYKIASEIIQ